jgi:hypothetical protein
MDFDIEILLRFKASSSPHHRSPTSAMEPAGQDPKAQFSPGTEDSTALFSQICQSILSNLVAELAKF